MTDKSLDSATSVITIFMLAPRITCIRRFWIILFPPSYHPPPVAVVIVAPLSYTHSPPHLLARNVVQLDIAHTHSPQ